MKQDTYIPMLFANITTGLQGIENTIPSGVEHPQKFIQAQTNEIREDLQIIRDYCDFLETRVKKLTKKQG